MHKEIISKSIFQSEYDPFLVVRCAKDKNYIDENKIVHNFRVQYASWRNKHSDSIEKSAI